MRESLKPATHTPKRITIERIHQNWDKRSQQQRQKNKTEKKTYRKEKNIYV